MFSFVMGCLDSYRANMVYSKKPQKIESSKVMHFLLKTMFGQDRSNNGYISRVDFLDVATLADPFFFQCF